MAAVAPRLWGPGGAWYRACIVRGGIGHASIGPWGGWYRQGIKGRQEGLELIGYRLRVRGYSEGGYRACIYTG